MDRSELSRRAKALPDRFADRLDPTGLRHVREDLGAGEWAEGLDNLIAGLANLNAPVTPEERDELAALLEAINLPTDPLSALTVHD